MSKVGARLTFFAVCLLLAGIAAYIAFILAWNPRGRFVFAILPGYYIAGGLNKVLKVSPNGIGVWILFFVGNVLFYFGVLVTIGALAARIRSRSTGKTA